MTTAVSPTAAAHHGLAAHEVVLLLETDPHRGLNSEDAASPWWPASSSGSASGS